MAARSNTKEFKEKANKKHKGRYIYSMVEYVNNRTRVRIICRVHGVFEQMPINHLKGHGCPRCSCVKVTKRIRSGSLRNSDNMKKCSMCGKTKSDSEFSKDKWCKDGLNARCKKCMAEHRRGHAKYKTYAHQLDCAEKVRNNNGQLEVTCTKCGKWFKPTVSAVNGRTSALNGNMRGEMRLYCSDNCKNSCSIYGQRLYHSGLNPNKDRPYQYEWAKAVKDRAGNRCEECGSFELLEAHHIRSVKTHPLLQADIDNGICLCTKCHKKAHKGDNSTGNLAKKIC